MRRTQRLRHRKEIAAVYRRGRSYRSELVTIRVLRTNLPIARFGFAVGGTVGNAVVRNRARRRLREIVGSLEVGSGWDVMIGARPGVAGCGFDELREAVGDVLKRAGVLERRVAKE